MDKNKITITDFSDIDFMSTEEGPTNITTELIEDALPEELLRMLQEKENE